MITEWRNVTLNLSIAPPASQPAEPSTDQHSLNLGFYTALFPQAVCSVCTTFTSFPDLLKWDSLRSKPKTVSLRISLGWDSGVSTARSVLADNISEWDRKWSTLPFAGKALDCLAGIERGFLPTSDPDTKCVPPQRLCAFGGHLFICVKGRLPSLPCWPLHYHFALGILNIMQPVWDLRR